MINSPFKTNEERQISRFMQIEKPAYRVYLHSPNDDATAINKADNNNVHLRVNTVETVAEGRKAYTRSINMTESQFQMHLKDGIHNVAKTDEGERVVSYTPMTEPLTEQTDFMDPNKYLTSGLDSQGDKIIMAL